MCAAVVCPQDHGLPSITLDWASQARLQPVLAAMPSPYADPEGALLALLPTVGMLSKPVQQQLRSFCNDPAAPGALLLRNLPRDHELPDTPQDGGRACEKRTWVSEAALLAVAQWLGEPFAYAAEKQGELIHNVVPVPGSEMTLSNEGSLVNLDMHTEAAFFHVRPHFILLVCLRGDAHGEARTTVATAIAICRHLDQGTLAVLQAPLFQLRVPLSFDKGLGEVRWSEPRPILTGPTGLSEICVNLNGVRPITAQAEQALETLRTVLQLPGVVQSVCLTPGDMLVVNNRKALHGRSPFRPRFDGRDRWLQRCYVRSDLWDGRSHVGAPLRVL